MRISLEQCYMSTTFKRLSNLNLKDKNIKKKLEIFLHVDILISNILRLLNSIMLQLVF